ncbi:WYL domain-containing protein [Massilia sp. BKSP1R2A-1]|uniref:WYL domain-containing protein n=1 Tax=Massilia sp. BKSP1R2A-1 TaxID=3422595 RepID=UPI003D34E685
MDSPATRTGCLTTRAAGEHLFETPLSEDQVLAADDAGRLHLAATVPNTRALLWWLLGFGDGVVIEEPASLREELGGIARRMAQPMATGMRITSHSSLACMRHGLRSRSGGRSWSATTSSHGVVCAGTVRRRWPLTTAATPGATSPEGTRGLPAGPRRSACAIPSHSRFSMRAFRVA